MKIEDITKAKELNDKIEVLDEVINSNKLVCINITYRKDNCCTYTRTFNINDLGNGLKKDLKDRKNLLMEELKKIL